MNPNDARAARALRSFAAASSLLCISAEFQGMLSKAATPEATHVNTRKGNKAKDDEKSDTVGVQRSS
jgi:hypothetical protein